MTRLVLNDEVRCNFYGVGKVVLVDKTDGINPIEVQFDSVNHRLRYRVTGKYADGSVKAKNITEVNGEKIRG